MTNHENERLSRFDPGYLVPGLPFYERMGRNSCETAGDVIELLLDLPAQVSRALRKAGAAPFPERENPDRAHPAPAAGCRSSVGTNSSSR